MNVSVALRLRDEFSGPVKGLIQQIQGLTNAAQRFNQALGGTGSTNSFARLSQSVRTLRNDVQGLVNTFGQLARASGASSSGGFAQSQIAGMRQLLQLQTQAIANTNRLAAGGGRGPTLPAASTFGGRPGFSPNASLVDRAQYRAVNFAEQSLVAGALDLDRARTNLLMLANGRRDPNNPDQLLPGVISPETVAQIEQEAVALTRQFRSLNRAHVLDTFKELVTQFSTPDSAFKLLPQLLAVQEWQVLQGNTVEQAREGMARLVRAMGLSGRLVGNDGQLNEAESGQFLENYLRARMIGGADVTPDQVFQVMKYLKTSGQTLSQDALLTAFIGMPDIRGSTFGNQLNMLVRQLTGGATQAAQGAMARAGLGEITERTQSGPHGFIPRDEVLLRENPFEWFNQHILGPQGVLRKMGLDPMTANAAQISAALRPMFSNQSAENLANAIVNQQAEWRIQVQKALQFNLTDENRRLVGDQSTWMQLQSARSKLQDVMGSVAENFKILLPSLEAVSSGFAKIAAFMDPKIGNPLAGLGIIGTAGIAAFLTFRRAIAALGPMARTLVGGGAGFLLGGPVGAMTGAMMLRGMGGGAAAAGGGAAATAAAGAAGAVAGASWGRRFLAGAMGILRSLPRFFVWGAVTGAVLQIIENWETVKTRLVAIFGEIKAAAPTWLMGNGEGMGAFGQNPEGVAALRGDAANYLRSWHDWMYGPVQSAMFGGNNSLKQFFDSYVKGEKLWPDESAPVATSPGTAPGPSSGNTINVAPGAVVVHISAPSADPKAIGDAAGSAVQSQLRSVLGDLPPMP
jgi:hypothetical protein